MKLSFSTLGCPNWGFHEIISTAKDLGYDGIEFRGVKGNLDITRYKRMQPDTIGDTRALLKQKELLVPCIDSNCSLAKADLGSSNIEELKGHIKVAAALGAPYIRVLGDTYAAPGIEPVDDYLVIDIASELGEYALKHSVTLLIETNGVYANSEHLAKLLQSVGSDAIACLWDIHHPFRYFKEAPNTTMQNLKAYIKHVHVKDSVMKKERVVYQLLGNGDIPVRDCIEILLDSGYDGFYSMEWLKRYDITLEEPGIVFAQYISYMRKLERT